MGRRDHVHGLPATRQIQPGPSAPSLSRAPPACSRGPVGHARWSAIRRGRCSIACSMSRGLTAAAFAHHDPVRPHPQRVCAPGRRIAICPLAFDIGGARLPSRPGSDDCSCNSAASSIVTMRFAVGGMKLDRMFSSVVLARSGSARYHGVLCGTRPRYLNEFDHFRGWAEPKPQQVLGRRALRLWRICGS